MDFSRLEQSSRATRVVVLRGLRIAACVRVGSRFWVVPVVASWVEFQVTKELQGMWKFLRDRSRIAQRASWCSSLEFRVTIWTSYFV